MQSLVCSIYDTVAEEYGPLFQSKNEGVALRQFEQLIQQHSNVNPEDMQLFQVATFNTETGHLEPLWKHIEPNLNMEMEIMNGQK